MEEMMISLLQRMTGLTPEQMQALSNNAINLLQSFDTRLKAIEDKLEIISHNHDPVMPEIKALEYDN